MKLVITGAGGQLGREWTLYCEQNKISFKAFSSKELNILDEEELAAVCESEQPDILINCAAYTKVDEAEDEQQLAESVNSEALKSISYLCKIHDIKLIHYSTDYVFAGTQEDQKNVPDGYPEDYHTNPVNVYGTSKRRGELAIIESGCDYLICRVSWLCGKCGNNFVKTMLRLGREKSELKVVNDQFGVPTFSSDVVSHTFELINKKESGIFHLGSKGIISWYEFAKEIFDQSEISVKVDPVTSSEFPTKAKRPAFSKLSTKKISKIDGIEIKDWKVGLKNLLEDLNDDDY